MPSVNELLGNPGASRGYREVMTRYPHGGHESDLFEAGESPIS